MTEKSFIIDFGGGKFSPAISIDREASAEPIVDHFGLLTPRPTIFISGGASAMSDEDIERTRVLMDEGIARFAAKHNITVIDGGTEAGVMQMIGRARKKNGYKFPLVGIAPEGLVSYPGYKNPNEQAVLEDGHSHFVLVRSDEWGGESQTIIDLTRAISKQQAPMMGILINGGKIAEHDVYLATAKAEKDQKVPMLIIEGSGRTADNVASAFRTGNATNAIIKAIVQGGDIRLTALVEGVGALLEKLDQHFGKTTESTNS